MKTKTLSNEFMQNLATEEAWRQLSEDFPWSELTLEKFQDKVDWKAISENSEICWTIPMIQKFMKKINWETFSESATKDTLTANIIEAFKDKWDWHKLSDNSNLTLTDDLLDKFADRWDWEMIIDNYSYETIRHDTFAFHEKCNPENNDSIIKVIGVGGGGGNAVNYMYKKGIDDVTFMLCDTDNQALNDSPVPVHLQLGQEGLGASNKPEKARLAAEESIYDVCSMLDDGTKIAFIIAGMGGGTGSGAAPVIAQKSKELGILTVGIVTIPFRFEGSKKIDLALDGVREMSKHMDALLVINNERLRENNPNLSISNSFAKADETLGIAAESMIETIMTNGLMNLDFNNIKTILKDCEVTTLKHNAIAFYEKYKDYISVSKLKDSVLWRNIVNQRAKQLKEELIIYK